MTMYGIFGLPFVLGHAWYTDQSLVRAFLSFALAILGFAFFWAWISTYASLVDQEAAFIMEVFGEYRELVESDFTELDETYTEKSWWAWDNRAMVPDEARRAICRNKPSI